MRGGKELTEPFPHLLDGIRLAKRNDKVRSHQVGTEVPSPKRTAAERVCISQDQRRVRIDNVLARALDVVRTRVLLHPCAERNWNLSVLGAPALGRPAAPCDAKGECRLKRPLVDAGLSAGHDLQFLPRHCLNSPLFLPPR